MSEERPKRLYELISERRVVREPEDELEELERLEMRELVREAKRLRLQELVEKYRRRLREMGVSEGEHAGQDGGAGSSLVDVEVAKYLASLPEEQRQRVLRDLQFLKAVERLPPQAAVGLMYMYALAGQQHQHSNPQGSQPQVSFRDLAEAVKILTDAAVRPSTPPEAQNAVVNILNNLVNMVTNLSRELTEERLKRIEERASYNPVDMVRSILDVAKEVKKLGGSEAANPDALIKLKELEAKTSLMLQRMQMEQQRWMQQQQLEMKKWENISKMFEGPVGKTLEMLGGATAARIRGSPEAPSSQQNQQQAVETPYGRMLRILCPKCSGALWVLESQDIVACPHCGTVLMKQVQQPQQREVKEGGVGSGVGAEGGSEGKPAQQAERKPA